MSFTVKQNEDDDTRCARTLSHLFGTKVDCMAGNRAAVIIVVVVIVCFPFFFHYLPPLISKSWALCANGINENSSLHASHTLFTLYSIQYASMIVFLNSG